MLGQFPSHQARDQRHIFLQAFQIPLESQHIPATLYSLIEVATVDAKTGATDRALQLAAFCGEHPSSHYQTKSRAERLRAQLETQLTPEQIEAASLRAQCMTLDSWARKLLSS